MKLRVFRRFDSVDVCMWETSQMGVDDLIQYIELRYEKEGGAWYANYVNPDGTDGDVFYAVQQS